MSLCNELRPCSKSELLLQTNPTYNQVPVLLHNGRSISQSLVILEYIQEAWPDPFLLPQTPYERALARFWADYINKKVIFILFLSFSLLCIFHQRPLKPPITLIQILFCNS
ncbi:hypothetical protein SUGI_0296210 [Cryptomeria japonica]|nr:hypothetical protein SUGI_0296210 [Cryptomeria japonica]